MGVGPESAPRREYDRQTSDEAVDDDQDVYLNVPDLYVESLDLEAADLRARVSLQAEVLSLLRLNVGVDAVLGQVRLDLRNVQAQALLKVRLDKVAEILNRVLATIDAHPEMIEPLARASSTGLQQAGMGVPETVAEAGDLADHVVQHGVPDLDQVSPGVPERPRREQREREPRERGGVRRARAEGPPPIETSATVEAEDARRQRLPGEQRRYRGLPRRAKRR